MERNTQGGGQRNTKWVTEEGTGGTKKHTGLEGESHIGAQRNAQGEWTNTQGEKMKHTGGDE